MQSNGMQLDATVRKALTKAIQLGFCRLVSIISMSGGPIFEKKVSLATCCADYRPQVHGSWRTLVVVYFVHKRVATDVALLQILLNIFGLFRHYCINKPYPKRKKEDEKK